MIVAGKPHYDLHWENRIQNRVPNFLHLNDKNTLQKDPRIDFSNNNSFINYVNIIFSRIAVYY